MKKYIKYRFKKADSSGEMDDFDKDLNYPFNAKEGEEKNNYELLKDKNTLSFNHKPFEGTENFYSKPTFQKACVQGNYVLNYQLLKITVESKILKDSSMKIVICFKNICDIKLENFVFNQNHNPGMMVKR